MKPLKTSMYLAFAAGILIPAMETIRRWHQLTDVQHFSHWFDDYVLGAILIVAAWRVHKSPQTGRLLLCAAWGFAIGMLFLSFMGQLQVLNAPDPAPLPSWMVALIKGGLLAGCVFGLVLALRRRH